MTTMTEAEEKERRRSARVNTRLLTQIAGVDVTWVLRRCNLSVTGMLLEMEMAVGEAGSVQHVRLLSPDRAHEVEVLARVVRTLFGPDLWRGSQVVGVAFDFLVQTAANRQAIADLVRQAMQVQGAPHAQVVGSTPAALEPAGLAKVHSMGFEGMVLRGSVPLSVGAHVRCQVQPDGSSQVYRLEGEVLRATPLVAPAGVSPVYEMEVRFSPEGASGANIKPAGLNIGDAIDALLEEAVFQSVDANYHAPREQLKGELARIRLPSLLSFMEMERLSGTLSLSSNRQHGTLFLRAGHVVDCEVVGHPGALPAIQCLLSWPDGEFEFRMNEVSRPDVVQMSTTHLLLKLTTDDESAAHQ